MSTMANIWNTSEEEAQEYRRPPERNSISFEGMTIHLSSDAIGPGDLYIAPAPGTRYLSFIQRKDEHWQILTCDRIKDGYIIPQEVGKYCYDVTECWKIESMD